MHVERIAEVGSDLGNEGCERAAERDPVLAMACFCFCFLI